MGLSYSVWASPPEVSPPVAPVNKASPPRSAVTGVFSSGPEDPNGPTTAMGFRLAALLAENEEAAAAAKTNKRH
ncbi:uncharacterized protein LOC62_06G008140 [Vanrija pseudolonga]|uniref:Uncharacterized protein n=1 Tax=Vanrija pseudolonga TaxID=143232 RepID=A0AAF0YH15_9TREE|nr:hypothetical protein LOC62_06G008140 [Vanrija pseudolonga]